MKQAIIIYLLLIMTSCLSQKSAVRKYYTIDLPENIEPAMIKETDIIPGKCEIQNAVIAPVYEKSQIANRSKTHEISYYIHHMWAVNPSESVKNYVYEFMQETGLFTHLSTRYSRTIPDYRLNTTVNDLEVIEQGKSFSAHLNIEFTLLMNSNDSILVYHKADRMESLKKKDMNMFASGISKILYEEISIFSKLMIESKSSIAAVVNNQSY